jgi:hypothetical protein
MRETEGYKERQRERDRERERERGVGGQEPLPCADCR